MTQWAVRRGAGLNTRGKLRRNVQVTFEPDGDNAYTVSLDPDRAVELAMHIVYAAFQASYQQGKDSK